MCQIALKIFLIQIKLTRKIKYNNLFITELCHYFLSYHSLLFLVQYNIEKKIKYIITINLTFFSI